METNKLSHLLSYQLTYPIVKISILTIALYLFAVSSLFAQNIMEPDQENLTIFSLSLGFASHTGSGFYGPLVTNDLKTSLGKNLYINPRLSFFQSIFNPPASSAGFNSHSGLFVDLGLSYSFLIEKAHSFSISAGPAYQTGSETRTISHTYVNDVLVDEKFRHRNIRHLGFYLDLDYNLNTTDKFIHSLGVKSYSFKANPFEFLALSYKIGFSL